jgi:hypothetical protein
MTLSSKDNLLHFSNIMVTNLIIKSVALDY